MEVQNESQPAYLKETLSCLHKTTSSKRPTKRSRPTSETLITREVDVMKSNCILSNDSEVSGILSLSDYPSRTRENCNGATPVLNRTECEGIQELSNNASDAYDTYQPSECATAHQTIESDYSLDSIPNSDVHNSCLEEENHSSELASPSNLESPNDSSDSPAFETIEDKINVDLRRTRRSSKPKAGDLCCPVCGLTIRLPELACHFNQEVEKLAKISRNFKKPSRDDSGISTTFVQVKSNRENRLSAKVAQYAAKAKKEVQCPVCTLRLSGSDEEVNRHVALCVQNDESSDEQIIVDDDEDDDESIEEYEFGDETRIRAIDLVPGGYRSLQGQSVRRQHSDEDLDVDIDDTMTFGQTQYTELDVIPNKTYGDDESSNQLRKAVLVDPTVQPHVLESRKWSDNLDLQDSVTENSSETLDLSMDDTNGDEKLVKQNGVCSDPVILSLKERLKDLEDQNKSVKCLICMESYTKPVVSTTCWHVHCEECWLMTMGVKKLCPQCNMIVFPSDLRRIYL